MSQGDEGKLSKIEDLKAKLFSRGFKTKVEYRDGFSKKEIKEVADSWETKDDPLSDFGRKFFMRTSIFKKFFILSISFFGLALLYGGYMFFIGKNTVSNENIDISILGNSFVAGGEELSLQISIGNRNAVALELADLVVEYPRNSGGELIGDTERILVSLGTITPGQVHNKNIKVILFGEQSSVRPVKFSLEYRVEGSNAIFVKEKIFEVNINSTPIDISLEAPEDISPNQDITLKIKATLNSTKTASKILVRVNYPLGFQFVSADSLPSFGNNVWNLGDMTPGALREISVKGRMIDVFEGEEKIFKAWIGSQSRTDKSAIDVIFNSAHHAFVVKKPFIEAYFVTGSSRQKEYAVDSKAEVLGEIRWINNLETQVNDFQIKAKISCNAIDRKSIRSQQGFYNSATDTIIWDRNYISGFGEIGPGSSGSVFFSFAPIVSLASPMIVSDPSIVIDLSVSGRQDISGFELKELHNSDSAIVKVISNVGFAAKGLYYSGPFTNSGPIPPKVQTATTFTIIWSLSNSSSNISKGVVRSSLPAWINFISPVSPANENLIFNSSTREITWNVGNIGKGMGITSPSREVAFRVSISPSLSQLGTAPILINEAILTGHDDFANVDVRVYKSPLSTRLTNDPSFPANGERVVE